MRLRYMKCLGGSLMGSKRRKWLKRRKMRMRILRWREISKLLIILTNKKLTMRNYTKMLIDHYIINLRCLLIMYTALSR